MEGVPLRRFLLLAALLAGCVEIDPITGRPIEPSASVSPAGVQVAPLVSGQVEVGATAPPVAPAAAASPLPSPSAGDTPTPGLTAEPTPSPSASQTAEPTPVPTSTPEPSPTPTPEPTPIPTQRPPIQLTGTGQQATSSFNVSGGLTTFKMAHAGDSNFAVWLLDSQGEKVDLLANVIGGYQGTQGLGLAGGSYLLDIKADGDWTVEINQPRAGLPMESATISGRGDAARGPWRLSSGLHRFTLEHDGDSNFAVWLLDEQGEKVELLVNEIGAFEGSTAKGLDGGLYFADIHADGDWSLTVE